jgi:1-acyl-sn-glycerol-3-phosphate acyltransferase
MNLRSKFTKIFQLIIFYPIYLLLRLFFGFNVVGWANLSLIDDKKGIIFASNHVSYIDEITTSIAIIIANTKNHTILQIGKFLPVRYITLKKLSKWISFVSPFIFPMSVFVASWMRLNYCIYVSPNDKKQVKNKNLQIVLKDAIISLKNHQNIFIFPEGRITRNGDIQRGKRGIGVLVKKTGCAVVPMKIEGGYHVFKLKNIINRQNKMTIYIGKIIQYHENMTIEKIADKTMDSINSLSNKK